MGFRQVRALHEILNMLANLRHLSRSALHLVVVLSLALPLNLRAETTANSASSPDADLQAAMATNAQDADAGAPNCTAMPVKHTSDPAARKGLLGALKTATVDHLNDHASSLENTPDADVTPGANLDNMVRQMRLDLAMAQIAATSNPNLTPASPTSEDIKVSPPTSALHSAIKASEFPDLQPLTSDEQRALEAKFRDGWGQSQTRPAWTGGSSSNGQLPGQGNADDLSKWSNYKSNLSKELKSTQDQTRAKALAEYNALITKHPLLAFITTPNPTAGDLIAARKKYAAAMRTDSGRLAKLDPASKDARALVYYSSSANKVLRDHPEYCNEYQNLLAELENASWSGGYKKGMLKVTAACTAALYFPALGASCFVAEGAVDTVHVHNQNSLASSNSQIERGCLGTGDRSCIGNLVKDTNSARETGLGAQAIAAAGAMPAGRLGRAGEEAVAAERALIASGKRGAEIEVGSSLKPGLFNEPIAGTDLQGAKGLSYIDDKGNVQVMFWQSADTAGSATQVHHRDVAAASLLDKSDQLVTKAQAEKDPATRDRLLNQAVELDTYARELGGPSSPRSGKIDPTHIWDMQGFQFSGKKTAFGKFKITNFDINSGVTGAQVGAFKSGAKVTDAWVDSMTTQIAAVNKSIDPQMRGYSSVRMRADLYDSLSSAQRLRIKQKLKEQGLSLQRLN